MAGSAQAGAAHGKPCPRGFWSPGPWIRSPGELEETAHNGRVRLNPSSRPAVESAALPSRASDGGGFLPEVREFIFFIFFVKDTGPKTNTTRGGRKAHRPTPKTRTIHPTVLPDR